MISIVHISILLFLVSTAVVFSLYLSFNNQKRMFQEQGLYEGQDHLSKYMRRTGLQIQPKSSKDAQSGVTLNDVAVHKLQADLTEALVRLRTLENQLFKSNPFKKFATYQSPPLQTFNAFPGNVPLYNSVYLGIKHNPNYCDVVDAYNLYNPENVFEKMNFIGDYTSDSLTKDGVFNKIGRDVMPQIYLGMKNWNKPLYNLDITTNVFFTKRVTFHNYYEIGRNFLCHSQLYNHIPGHGILTRKDLNVKMVNDYAKRYENNTQCFNKKMFFPYAYRLNNATECVQFFQELNSEEYRLRRLDEPVTFVIKKGYGAHRAEGIYMFNQAKEKVLRSKYANGRLCGSVHAPLLAQYYIANPLLLDKNNKFDFRVYMLIASVDPLIVYYHDGFLRVSLQTYDKHSNTKSVHFTNTHLSKELFEIARVEEEHLGMSETEMREYQMWTMEDLQAYLLESGKIADENWLDNYLKPKFKEAYLHAVRMSRSAFMKHPGVFELFGLDFLLDESLNLWFIECNASPQLVGTNEYKTVFLTTLLKDMFEIQFAYLRSRWTRIHKLMRTYHDTVLTNHTVDLTQWKDKFNQINTNYLEPEYKIKETNTWQLILDENIGGKAAYLGHLRDECIDDA